MIWRSSLDTPDLLVQRASARMRMKCSVFETQLVATIVLISSVVSERKFFGIPVFFTVPIELVAMVSLSSNRCSSSLEVLAARWNEDISRDTS